ncbi:aldo/keto reductase [Arthrobacter sp. NEB 688]|uniref:aldo/keto reductase n=1 Tax=Arthrobacter sp. NEB 688 TaxID=904039 RepID=UPI002570F65E|nr:aldo/keto reductase [Arthrobacter sp. NEB 688]
MEGSLTRLATDHVDILWVHYPDELTPMDEILRGLDDLVTQGKVLHVAFSNFPAWRVSRAAVLADVSGWAPVAGIQVEYSLVQRTADRELLPMAEALGLGATLWSPLGGGLLTGKYRHSREGRLSDWGRLVHTEDDARATAVVDTLLEVAGSVGRPPAQVAVAWLLEHGRRMTTSATPIIGPRTLAQLDDYLAALEVQLDDEGYRRLETVSRPSLGIPHEANAAALDGLRGGPGSSVTAPAVPVA